MIDKILNFKNQSYNLNELKKYEKEIIDTYDPRLMFLFLNYVDHSNINLIGKKILETKSNRYIHFLLRTFNLNKYDDYLDYILNNTDSRYLYNILYDVDYLKNEDKIKIINNLFELNDDKYLFKGIYYYFVILDLFNKDIFLKTKNFLKEKLSIVINDENYKNVLNNIMEQENKIIDPKGFSQNCYKGRKDLIPNIIVCHINNTYSSAINHFYNGTEVSCHYLIRRDGHIKQIISLDDSAWANGTSKNDSSDVYYKFSTLSKINSCDKNANYFTFSIEHESFDGSLTDEQLKASIKVIKEIIQYVKIKYNYDIPIDREHIIGHNEVNPIVRKKCPGDKFPFDKIISELKNSIY